jgi:hypothetical protein
MIRLFNIISLILFVLLISCPSCEEKADWELDTNVPKVIVVEGVLTNERKAHEVRISQPMTDPNNTPQPVRGAFVAIYERDQAGNNRAFRLGEVQAGRYVTDTMVRAFSKRLYTLFILYQGQEYWGSSNMVEVPQLLDFEYRKVTGTELWYELILRDTRKPSMLEINLDWSHLMGFRNHPPEQTSARIIHYTVNSVDVNKIFKPAKEKVIFPAGTRVHRRQYSMNREQEEFVRTLMAETEWRGGLFDVQPGNVRTNLSEGAVGYFSVSEVVEDFHIITPK